jgi:hypothetical protein
VTRTRVVLLGAALAAALAATLGALAGRGPDAPPDPQEAVLDGCGRNYIAQTQRQIPTWVYVGDRNYPAAGPMPPAQRLERVVTAHYLPDLASHPTEEDLPSIHRSYDVNFDVRPDPAYADLMGGSPAQHTGNYAGKEPSTARVHVEREQGAPELRLAGPRRPRRDHRLVGVGASVSCRPATARSSATARRSTSTCRAAARGAFMSTRECDFGSLGNADGAAHPMAPCPKTDEFGTFDGDDRLGYINKHFHSPEASLGFHRGRLSRRALTTRP